MNELNVDHTAAYARIQKVIRGGGGVGFMGYFYLPRRGGGLQGLFLVNLLREFFFQGGSGPPLPIRDSLMPASLIRRQANPHPNTNAFS